ncbi:hypothetical protein Dvina_51685 [Dactylosporangium vinaceum]|uniref:Uncharacterized protein n=1 Tax=Dactylosporangium vinaceum TaxID=53362 RepID=A0ABV5M2M6_9ACTN|nr:hypothetical protein [Dactylosporangium vinaceum]UAB96308.1 hypothetical protein Dvina_51685 [Dactylosporangium vinaceum]
MTVSATAAHRADRDTSRDVPDDIGTAPLAGTAGTAADDIADAASDGGAWPSSPFACVDAAFTALTSEPHPLRIDLSHLDPALGVPAGPINLADLRTWLAEHRRDWPALDAVWRELITRARLDGPAWVVAATALALPALVRAAADLVAGGWRGDPDDVDAEVLTGFLTALRDTVDTARPAPYAGLRRAAQRAGLALVAQQRDVVLVDDIDAIPAGPRTPHRPWGHPDLLVRRAVELGLLDPGDEQPYIDTRLGRRAIEPIAARLDVTVDALRMRLRRVDERLTRALADGILTGTASPQAQQALARQAEHRQATRTAVAADPNRTPSPVPSPVSSAAPMQLAAAC